MCAIFTDKKQRAKAHLQCVPKRHIKDFKCLRPSEADIALVKHMYAVGEAFLKKHHPSVEGYRLGFHRPGSNSQFHLHMHLISLPLADPRLEARYGGKGLKKVPEVIEYLEEKLRLKERQSREERKD